MSIERRKYGFVRALGLALGVAGLALCATLSSFAAAPGQAKRPGAKAIPEATFQHMDAALGYLNAADTQLKEGEPIFSGHRVAAMKHTEAAIADLQKGINEYIAAHPGTARNRVTPEPPPSEAGDKFPKMHGGLKLLQQAEAELNEASRVFNGERVAGLNETHAAVNEIQVGMKLAASQGH